MIENDKGKFQIHLRYRKAMALLAFLIAERNRNHSRAHIAYLLWPELNEQAARINLRQVLSTLSKLFKNYPFNELLKADRHNITFQSHPMLSIDVAYLEDMQNYSNNEINIQQQIINEQLLTGVFMAGYSLPDCDEFEEWINQKRAYYRGCQTRLINSLIVKAQNEQQPGLVVKWAQLIHQLNPDNELLLRDAMLLCSENGQTRLALRMFESFAKRMKEEIGVLPDSQTQLLYERLTRQLIEPTNRQLKLSQFPAIEKISPVIVVNIQWQCNLKDPEAIAQELFNAKSFAREFLCEHMNAYYVDSAGKGSFFYFSWPKGIEDSAWLAVRCSIRLMEHTNRNPDINLKIGIHSGIVYSSISSSIPDLIGDTSEEVLLLSQSASEGQILLSEPCYRLVKNKILAHKLIEYRRRSDGSLLSSFSLDQETTWYAENHYLSIPEFMDLSNKLNELYNQKKTNQSPKIICLEGSKGSGKTSSVIHWLKIQRQAGVKKFKLQCYPDHIQSPLFPIISCVRQLLGFRTDETIEPYILKERVERHGWYDLLDNQIIVNLLSNNLTPIQKDIDIAINFTLTLLKKYDTSNLVIWIEDGQWIDSDTLQLIDKTSKLLIHKSLFLLFSTRKLSKSNIPWIKIQQPTFSKESASRLLSFFSKSSDKWYSPDDFSYLLHISDHNPYLLKLLTTASNDNVLEIETLEFFSYSIDQLGKYRECVSDLAIINPVNKFNKQFSAAQNPIIINTDKALKKLISDKLIILSEKQNFNFNPPLLQNALALISPPSRQKLLHQTLTKQLKPENFNNDIDEYNERLAHHLHGAGEISKASQLYILCGQHRLNQRNYIKGVNCLEKAIKLSQLVDYSLETRVTLLNDIAQCRIMAYGYGDRRAFQYASEAFHIAKQSSDKSTIFRALYLIFLGIGSSDAGTSRIETAKNLCDQAQTPAQLTIAHWTLANAHFWRGDFILCREQAEQSLFFNKQLDPSEFEVYSHENPEVLAIGFIAWSWCFDGHLDQAIDCCEQLLAIPKKDLSNTNRCFQLFFVAFTLANSNDTDRALAKAKECHELAKLLQNHLWLCASELLIFSLSATRDDPVTHEKIDWLIHGIHNSYKDGLPIAVLLGVKALINSGHVNEASNLLKHTLDNTDKKQHDLLHNTLQGLLDTISLQ